MVLGKRSSPTSKKDGPLEAEIVLSNATINWTATVFVQARGAFLSVIRPLSRSFGQPRLLAHFAPRTACFPQGCNLASISGDLWSTKALTLRACVAQAGLHALLNQRTLKLSHGANYVEHQASRRRRKIKVIRQAHEGDSSRFQFGQGVNEMP